MEAKLLWKVSTIERCEKMYQDLRREATAEGCEIAPSELATRRRTPASLKGGTSVWAAINLGRLVGVVALSRKSATGTGEFLWLWSLYVRVPYRGTPASRLLMDAAINAVEGEPNGVRMFAAYAKTNYRAHRYFSRMGFDVCAWRPGNNLPATRSTEVLVERLRTHVWAQRFMGAAD